MWRKNSGTGNTGWTVVDGDTGWVSLASWTTGMQDASAQIGTLNTTDFVFAGTGKIEVRRIGTAVLMRSYSSSTGSYFKFNAANASRELFTTFAIPAGFQLGTRLGTGLVAANDANGLHQAYVSAAATWSDMASLTLRCDTANVPIGCVVLSWTARDLIWPVALGG